ncbi:hypothetical protein [Streptomyces sp. TP-A0356]|uniref:hypothetical protein n=1 Tax=Streptomyces sp. TP-A0356 TaxID=1359208 RepID=UPI0006E160BE|nr:hypothetical protein [Streptomyces sp. TP-A0356]
MGIGPLTRRTATRAAVVLAGLLPPLPAHALGASTARLAAASLPVRTSALAVRVARDIRSVTTAVASRLRSLPLPLLLPRRSGPSCALAGHRQEDPTGAEATARLHAALTLARELLSGLAARHRPRFLTRPAEPVSGTRTGSVPYKRMPDRPPPDATP